MRVRERPRAVVLTLVILFLFANSGLASPITTAPWVVIHMNQERRECEQKWEKCKKDILRYVEELRRCAEKSPSYRVFLRCRNELMGEGTSVVSALLFVAVVFLLLLSPLGILLYLDRKGKLRR